jgi:hypothetical protein
MFHDKGETMSMPNDEQLSELFAGKEDDLNESGSWHDLVSNDGGQVAFVQLDVEAVGGGAWNFVARVVTEDRVEISDETRQAILDDLESIADDLYQEFETIGLDPQDMADYKVVVIADEDQ